MKEKPMDSGPLTKFPNCADKFSSSLWSDNYITFTSSKSSFAIYFLNKSPRNSLDYSISNTKKKPQGIAVDPSGNVFIADFENGNIQKFTNDGKFIREWKKHDFVKDDLFGLSGIAVDKSGNVFVVDSGFSKERIQKYSNTGKFIRQWGSEGSGDGQFNGAGDVATDPSGNVFVTDFDNNRIQKFTNTGKFITKWSASDTTIVNVNVFAMR